LPEPDLRKASWFYMVPLLAISDSLRLRSLLIDPAIELLKGTGPEQVFAELPEALRFRWVEGSSVPAES